MIHSGNLKNRQEQNRSLYQRNTCRMKSWMLTSRLAAGTKNQSARKRSEPYGNKVEFKRKVFKMINPSYLRAATGSLLVLATTLLCLPPSYKAITSPATTGPDKNNTVPAYHSQAPSTALPNTMNPNQFKDPIAQACYRRAAEIRSALYQMPCYCHCDRHFHHKSLLGCYVSNHASVCDICQKEMLYTYEELKKGTSIQDIRQGIIAQKWTSIDLDKYTGK